MKNLGAAKRILGMEISRERVSGILYLTQTEYVKKIVELFGMLQAKPVGTPLASHFKLSAIQGKLSQEKVDYMKRIPYSNAIGSLMYAMIGTKLDIAYGVSLVRRYTS